MTQRVLRTHAIATLTVACALTTICGCSGAHLEQPDALPVTRVVLYQNGVGYFERAGEVEGDTLAMSMRPDQINDMLMSLTVIDRRGGDVASVSLPVEKSSSMVLGELPPAVRNAGGLLAVLESFRGAGVSVVHNKGSVDGRVVGVERVTADQGAEQWRVTLLTEDGELVPIRLEDIRRVEIADRTLTVGLDRALDTALGEGDWKPITLKVHFPDDGTHEIAMSYVVAMPTWKPAYRVIFDDERVRLQGWAVVDNVSGEDWNDVRLSLTAGAPISFIVDLHTPRLPRRPDLTGRTYSEYAEAPPEALEGFRASPGGGASAPSSEPKPAPARRERRRKAKRKKADLDDSFGAEAEDSGVRMDSQSMIGALESQATGERVGALFRYDVGVPVTVPDGSSALVTIVNADVEGEDLLLYDPTSGSPRARTHPYRSVRLHNTTGLVLERGPLTIYRSSTFVGEGIAAQIGVDETVFIPYSVESGVHVEQFVETGDQEQHLVKIKDGVATVESFQLYKQRYTITNRLGDETTLYLRVDKLPGHELKQPTEAIAQGEVYFVKVPLDGATTDPIETAVVQASRAKRTVTLFDPTFKTVLELYISAPDADPAVKKQLEKVLGFKKEIGDIVHREQALQKRQRQLRDRAQDLRSNIKVLGEAESNRKLREQLSKKLGGVEKELSSIDRELVELNERKYGLEVEMRELFEGITFER